MEKESEEFNPIAFEKKLTGLKDTQESIQSMSSWCLKQRTHHKKIVSSWLNVLKRVKVEQRLVLFYLANDVIQYSKRKNYEFVESWGLNLQKATPLVRDEKVRKKILRIFKIWEQRSVYDEEFLSDLTGLLSAGAIKKAPDDDAIDFQPQQLVNKIKQCSVLEADTDLRLKFIHDSHLQLSDADALCANLKERRNMDEVEKELGEGIDRVERYTAALQREIVAREALLALLSSAHLYYNQQRGEVKVVAYAYKNFGARVRCLKRKLDERLPKLPPRAELTPSPPRPDDVPSPEPDEELQLPGGDDADNTSYNIDKTFSASISGDYGGGFSSFLGADNPFTFFQETADAAGSKIEVISNAGGAGEKPDFNINDFLKTLSDPSTVQSIAGGISSQKTTDALPGLDLLTPESSGAAPPQLSFYGSLDNSVQDEPESYNNDPQWSNTPSSWSISSAVAARLPTPPVAPVPPAYSTTPAPTTYAETPVQPAYSTTPVPPAYSTTPAQPAYTTTPAPAAYPTTPAPAAYSTTPAPAAYSTTPAAATYADTPESPPPPSAPHAPPVAPLLVPDTRHYGQDMAPRDIDIRSLLPPPPPPPPLPLPPLSMPHVELEDVDHRQLPLMPPAAVAPPPHRHQPKDVDHRNLISLTSLMEPPVPRPAPVSMDQDYRVPPAMSATDIVESVDMDLSDDEQHAGSQRPSGNGRPDMMYQADDRRFIQPPPTFEEVRNRNNKVLVGRDNGTRNQNHHPAEPNTSNLIHINSAPSEPSHSRRDSIDIFDSMEKLHGSEPAVNPKGMAPVADERPESRKLMDVDFDNIDDAMKLMNSGENSNDSAYSEDLRSRFPDQREVRNPSPPRDLEEEWARYDNECQNPPSQQQQQFRGNFHQNPMNPRFQRNWSRPQQNFRPQGFGQQFWPRNGPRPSRPWMGQRPRGGFW